VGKTIVLVRTFGRLRFTELENLDAEAGEPDANGWSFITTIKMHADPEVVTVPRLRELALDPVRHLLQLRDRIRLKRTEMECMEQTVFWMREDGRRMSYENIRTACKESMRAAGIDDNKPHHLKSAAITELQRSAVPPVEIVAYARHKQGSYTWANNYLDTGNSRESVQRLASVK
jgi:hypothetical protein